MTTYSHNQKVTCNIEGIAITDARISINKDGTPFICQNVKSGADAEDKLGYKYSWALYSDFTTDSSVTNLKPAIKTLDNLAWKDILVKKNGNKRMVLGLLNDLVLMSYVNNFGSADRFYTKKQLQDLGYTVENLQESEELTLEQVCKELGRVVKIKGQLQGMKTRDETIADMKLNGDTLNDKV